MLEYLYNSTPQLLEFSNNCLLTSFPCRALQYGMRAASNTSGVSYAEDRHTKPLDPTSGSTIYLTRRVQIAMERARYSCQLCHWYAGASFYTLLHVESVNPQLDHNDPDNVIILCSHCLRSWGKKRKILQRESPDGLIPIPYGQQPIL